MLIEECNFAMYLLFILGSILENSLGDRGNQKMVFSSFWREKKSFYAKRVYRPFPKYCDWHSGLHVKTWR